MSLKEEIILRLSKRFSVTKLRGIIMSHVISETTSTNAATIKTAENVANGVIVTTTIFIYGDDKVVSAAVSTDYIQGYKVVVDEKEEKAIIVKK